MPFWTKLVRAIGKRQVLPIVGPGLSLVETPEGSQPIRSWLAPRLAEALELDTKLTCLNQVVCQHLIQGGRAPQVYEEVGILIDELLDSQVTLPRPLRDLASITDFDLFLTTAFDPFLGLALEAERPGYSRLPPAGSAAFHPTQPVDLPDNLPSTFLYHILGTHDTLPDFGVWEDDYLEFTCGLLSSPPDTLRNLFAALRNRSLLLIGSPFNDWIVRFFLRMAKGKRLSTQVHEQRTDYFAEHIDRLEEPMVFFFDEVLRSPQIISTHPAAFTAELLKHWRGDRGGSGDQILVDSIPDEPEDGAIFISYSRDDEAAALNLIRGLRGAGLPVWFDKKRLRGGSDWENHLLRAIKARSSLFLSLVSNATEGDHADPENRRFVHTERRWAAEKHIPGLVFYQPVLIEPEPFTPKLEPEAVARLNRIHLPGGQLTPEYARQLKAWHEEFKLTREIRDV